MSEEKPSVGRPTSYRPEYAAQAHKLCLLGATDQEIADFFEVSRTTITNWKAEFPEFVAALKTGKGECDERVERSLFHRAVGYTYDAVKIFMPAGADAPVYAPYREHVPPDTTAMIFWLKNRRQNDWRDVHKHEHGKPGDFEQMNADQLRGLIVAEAEALGLGDIAAQAVGRKGKTNGARRPH